jgi:carbamoyl-phosphate synthase small subunit
MSSVENQAVQAGRALIALEDGTFFFGRSCGAPGECFGEMVFNTGMSGYQELLTDPSYRGQIVVMTYPEIGIYGVNPTDVESGRVQVAGFVVHRAVRRPSNQRATGSLTAYLSEAGIVALEGVDTRALTRHIRTQGAMRGAISTRDLEPQSLISRVRASPGIQGRDLVREVSPREAITRDRTDRGPLRVVLVDAGAKGGIERHLAPAQVCIVPYDAGLETVLALAPDGVIVSNGPGDPSVLEPVIQLIRGLLARRVPLAGICLGHQLLGLALGARTYKMAFGHRGLNHPVKDLLSGRVLITTHNHGFGVDPTSLGIPWTPIDAGFRPQRPELAAAHPKPGVTMAALLPDRPLVGTSPHGFGPVEVTHLSLNDGTIEGLRLRDYPALAVQYHPEAAPGPHDARGFFPAFARIMETQRARTH